MKTSHENEQEALEAALGPAAAAEGKPWMVAVWCVDEEGKMVMHRTTWNFPLQRMTEARELLRENMAEELCPRVEPLPLAGFLKRTGANNRRLMGADGDELN